MTMNFNELLEAVKTTADSKDIKRINDLVAKAPGNIPTQIQLAANMCKSIKDSNKMQRRYDAAV